MISFTSPQRDIDFLLFDLFGLDKQWADMPGLQEVNAELAQAVIAEGGTIASEVLAPRESER